MMARKNIQRALLVLIVVGLVLLATYRLWLPRVDALYLLWPLRAHVGAMTMATPITLATSTAQGKTYTLGALTLAMPWHTQETVERGVDGYSSIRHFGTKGEQNYHAFILLKNPSLRNSLAQQDAELSRYFDKYLHTNAATLKYLMHTTPKTISLVRSHDPFAQALLMKFKDTMILNGAPVFSFTTTQGVVGYLTHKNASTTLAEFFTADDQEYTLILVNATEEEVASVLQSVRTH